jgi:NAD(P)-dependent dehydrogenase (short-subunit alcohol dehydrogenase family)
MSRPRRLQAFADNAEHTARRERAIQKNIDRADKASGKGKAKKTQAMQAGTRTYPTSFPKQHLEKPGLESELALQPMYQAPQYRGSEKLRDMVALITGGDSGIGRAVAVLYAREGADVAITYLNEHADAEATKRAAEAEGQRCITMAGDVADLRFCEAAVEQTIAEFGKLDILVNNAAFQEHVMRLEDLTEEHFDRTVKTNLYGYFHMVKAAVPHMKPGSSIVMNGSHRHRRQQISPRLFHDQGRHPRFHAFAFGASHRPRHSGQCDSTGTGVDTAQPRGQAGRAGGQIRHQHRHEAGGAARGNRARLRLHGGPELLKLYHRRDPSDRRRLSRRIGRGGSPACK